MQKKRKPKLSKRLKRMPKKTNHTYQVLLATVLGLIVIAGIILFATHVWSTQTPTNYKNTTASSATHSSAISAAKTFANNTINQTTLAAQVIPQNGYTLSFKWGNSVHKLVETNALDVSNLSIILNGYKQPLTPVEDEILNGTYNGYIQFNSTNAEFVQLVLWSLGINNNNTILNKGQIINVSASYAEQINSNASLNQKVTPQYVASHYFASTGGYGSLGKLQLSELDIINLTSQQQALMYDVATNSYRPCCDNPTSFPDCNHGAAALGLIELLASHGANETQMFNAIRYFYQYQFPQQYTEIAAYFDSHGENYSQVNSSEVMGASFSSYSGFSNVNQYLLKNGILQQSSGSSASCGA